MSDDNTSATKAKDVTVSDSKGRSICVRKLSPLQRMKIFEILGPELSENGPYLSYAVAAASLVSVDGTLLPFPQVKSTIEANIQLLGDEGLDAVSKAYANTLSIGESGNLEEIKN